ncbi:MAG: bifunctional UDP-sugar hydrolase/5'-nucleotidase [Candidatus Limiplasma sp.]|nr:bifunctional UDP-sugar hydrolase/5'-nucleotidase [Candidatus Limiplasma sp.]
MKRLLGLFLALSLLLGLAPALAEAPALTKDIVVVYVNDVHCGVDSNFGYAGLVSYRNKLLDEGNHVTMVDNGDAVQGEPIGTLSTGSYLIDIMNHVGFDLAVPGNHEFDYGMERFLELAQMAEFPYVAANFIDLRTGEPVFAPYKILEYDGVKVAYVGIVTPKTFTASTPAYFQDAEKNFIYSFCQGANGQELYDVVQAAVDAARAEGADYVVAMAHLGIAAEAAPWMSTDVILNTTGIDVMLDGHSHSVLESERVKNKEGKEVLLSSTGTKLENIGVLRISKDGTLSTSLLKYSAETAAFIQDIQKQFEETLNQVVAKSEVELVINEPGTDPAVRIIRVAETNLGDLCADAYKAMSGADIAFVNGGGIRVNIKAGDVTYNDILKVHPFGNALCMVEATGQEILDALEMGARVVPEENGGFLQVAGLTYEIHTYVPNSVKLTDEGLFVAVEGEYRVKNVMVGGEPLDLTKTYTLASHNYMLKSAGDGFTMFQDNPLLLEDVMLDNQVLINYITQGLGGTVGEGYTDPHGQGRIVAVPEKPE